MSGCLLRAERKARQLRSYRRTLAQKCGSNECVLTKISHNFHCHFKAPTLCGGLQSPRWRQRVGGGRRTSRHWSRERVSGAWLVCQSPSIPSTVHPHAHWQTQSSHTQTHTNSTCTIPTPFVTTFWNPQDAVVKRGRRLTASCSPPAGCRGQTGLLLEEQQQQQSRSKVLQTDRRARCAQTPNIDTVYERGAEAFRALELHVCLVHHSDAACVCVWGSESWSVRPHLPCTLAQVCTGNFVSNQLKIIEW